jgi:two-component system response regulator AtoC/two-component system nitrogen regulation response regulator NtrX
MASKILIVDDEESARYGIRRALEDKEAQIFEAGSAEAARAVVKIHHPEVMLTDINMPEEDGIDLMKSLADDPLKPVVVMITAYGSAKVAVEAMKSGAYDYVTKPFEIEELRLVVGRALQKVALERENRELRKQLAVEGQFGRIIGKSQRMQQLFERAAQLAETDVTVLIEGESGTGKELLAHEIHDRSSRKKGPFIAVNCAALPDTLIESELFGHEKGAFTGASEQRKGKFEQAHNGTIFLDEVGDMNALTQAKVLRVLEERKIERLGGNTTIAVDVRILSATHKDLVNEVENGRFRKDLLYRLRVVTLQIPALRERKEDLPLLVQSFLSLFAARQKKENLRLTPEALRYLSQYQWPGNIRELRNIIEGCVALNRSGSIDTADLPTEIQTPKSSFLHPGVATQSQSLLRMPYKEAKRQFEMDYIAERLRENDGNISRTAAQIGLHRQSLQQKLRELGIER